jgi:hypothetical protein
MLCVLLYVGTFKRLNNIGNVLVTLWRLRETLLQWEHNSTLSLRCLNGLPGNNVILFSTAMVMQHWFQFAVLPNDKIIPAAFKNTV